MLDTLQFVRGAVAEKSKDLVPVLTHFCIDKGRIQGADGRLAIDAPCPELQFTGVIPAERFLRAVDACNGEPKLKLTDKSRLVVELKPFRAMLPVLGVEGFPKSDPSTGARQAINGELLPGLRQLRPFISTDAERPWASTIYFSQDEGVALAATNAMIAMVKTNPFAQDMQVPVFCVDELLRIANEPKHYSVDDVSITFWWGDRWLRSQKINAEWPVLTAKKWLAMKAKMQVIPLNLAHAIERILPFCPDPKFPVIHFKSTGLSTAPGDVQAEVGGFNLGEATVHSGNLLPMLACSDKIAITKEAVLFTGPKSFRGVMSVLRL